MQKTQVIGNANELKCMLAFIELGYQCSIPYGNSAKYDFIVDIGNKLYKIQCKSSRHPKTKYGYDEGSIIITTVYQTTNTKETKRYSYSEKDVDYFATCFNDIVYLIPFNECGNSKILRLLPPKNNQKEYNNASDYELSKIIDKIKN